MTHIVSTCPLELSRLTRGPIYIESYYTLRRNLGKTSVELKINIGKS